MSTTFKALNQSKQFLKENARSKWEQTYKIKDEHDKYLHPLTGLAILLRVEYATIRAFFWFYSIIDANKFIQYVHEEQHSEAHEVIIHTNRIKLFFDIDLHLTDTEVEDLIDFYSELSGETDLTIDDVARHLAHLYYEATLASLESNGNDLNELQKECDMMFSTRNRNTTEDTFKISIHLITNIVCSVEQCRAIVTDVKSNVLFYPDDYGLEVPEDHIEKIANGIDVQPYHRHGSISISGGRKIVDDIEYVNEIQQHFQWRGEENFITRIDSVVTNINLNEYGVAYSSPFESSAEVSKEYVELVLSYLHKIPYYNQSDWDIEVSTMKGCVMRLRRVNPSYCVNCERTHDNDNTLLIIFNEEKGLGFWKCDHAKTIKSKVFYREDRVDEDIEAFAQKYSCKALPKHATTDSGKIEELTIYEEKPDVVEPIEQPIIDTVDSGETIHDTGYESEPEVTPEKPEIVVLDMNDSDEISDQELSDSESDEESDEESEESESDEESVEEEITPNVSYESEEEEEILKIKPTIQECDSDAEVSDEEYESDTEEIKQDVDTSDSIGASMEASGGFVSYEKSKKYVI